MNLQWLYYFNTIAELEHYTRAAERLHVSQSNLSHAIKELEEELGAELFERKGRNIKLTKYGEIFHPYVQKTISSLEEGISTLKEYIDPNVGTIVLAGFQSVAQFATDPSGSAVPIQPGNLEGNSKQAAGRLRRSDYWNKAQLSPDRCRVHRHASFDGADTGGT